MRIRTPYAVAAGVLLATTAIAAAAEPPRSWPLERTQPILDKTMIVRLAPDLSGRDPGRLFSGE